MQAKPNPADWLTIGAVAQALDVSRRTVMRMVARRVLRDYSPVGADGERAAQLFWWDDVQKLRAARAAAATAAAAAATATGPAS